MKFIYAFIFLLVLSCNTVKKEYVCGDHSCIDKKEFNEYFSKNLSIEIKPQTKNKNKNVDLVKLNTDPEIVKKKRNYKKDEKITIKNEKEELKLEKIRLLEEQKIRDNEEKNKAGEEKIAKLKEKREKSIENKISNNREQVNKIVNMAPEKKKIPVKDTEKITSVNSVKSENMKSICVGIVDCDIDKITELLIKKGKDKPFPNITSN
jgi:hypothetical protein